MIKKKSINDVLSSFVVLEYLGADFIRCIPDTKIVIYGIGAVGKVLFKKIKEYRDVILIVDNNQDGRMFNGVEIISEQKLEAYNFRGDITVIVTTTNDSFCISERLNSKNRVCRFLGENGHALPLFKIIIDAEKELIIGSANQRTRCFVEDVLKDRYTEKRVLVVASPYTFFLSMLILEDYDNVVFIICSKIIRKIADGLTKEGFILFDFTYDNNDIRQRVLDDFLVLLANYVKDHSIEVYGHDHTEVSSYFYDLGIKVVEDGLANYKKTASEIYDVSVSKKIDYSIPSDDKLKNQKHYYPFGFDDLVKDVFLTRVNCAPKELRKKAHQISIKDIWESNPQKKEILFRLFELNDDIVDVINSQNRHILYLTSDNSSVKNYGISRRREEELVIKILSNYNLDEVMIKPHPGDNINYEELVPGCVLMPKSFPVEILFLIDNRIDMLVGVGSTALTSTLFEGTVENYNLNGEKVK